MSYLHLLILIATLQCKRIVRRLVRPATPCDLDDDMIGWLNIMATCHDHAIITAYAKNTYT